MNKPDFSDLMDYCIYFTSAQDEVLQALERETHLKTIAPQMIAGPLVGNFLRILVKMCQAKNVLEIGTFTGYSTIHLALSLPDNGKVHTIEINQELSYISEKYFRKAKLLDRIIPYKGDALEIIPALEVEFDLIFVDAGKHNYTDYYNLCKNKLSSNGIMIFDNVLWGGKVINRENEPDARQMQLFNQMAREDPGTISCMLPIRDGLLLIQRM
jgi:predicted O-methyltransferase YrrM